MNPALTTLRGDSPLKNFNFIDRAIAFLSPNAGCHRLADRTRLTQFGVYDNPWQQSSSGGLAKNANTESWIKNRDRLQQMWDARDLCTYDWIGGTLARVILYTCGHIHCKSNTGDPEIDDLYDTYWKEWGGEDEADDGLTKCDISGRFTFTRLVQLALFGRFCDGDHGWIFRETESDDLPGETDFQIQSIEADRIGSPIEASQSEEYIGGITIDTDPEGKTGRILSYRVYDRTRVGQYKNAREIEPVDFVHIREEQFSSEYRGRTILRPVINDLKFLREWFEAEHIAGKTQSQYAAMVGSKDPFAKVGASAWTGKTSEGTPTQQAIWGKILRMSEGESFNMMTPSSRPTGAFMAFVQATVRKISTALDLPYGFVWDLATLGGVTARIETQQAQRKIQGWQHMLKHQALNRTRRRVLAHAIAYNRLPAHPGWKNCEWYFGPWIVTDAGYEVRNDIELIQSGIGSISQISHKYGGDIREVFRRNVAVLQDAQNLAAETRKPIELFAQGMFPNATEQLAAIQTPPQPPPLPGSVEAVGEKGAKTIIDLLENVTTGKMERDAAVNALVTIYGLDQAQAEAITPEQGKIESEKPEEPEAESKPSSKKSEN